MAKPKFTVANFAKFLASKPAHKRYDYMDVENCAAAEFSRLCGRRYASALFCNTAPSRRGQAQRIENIACGGGGYSWTYGAALKRARAMLAG